MKTETKRQLDDEIRSLLREGKRNHARDMIKLKNKMLEQVDEQIPEYKAARNVYAGDSELLDAAEEGTKILRADIDYLDDLVRTMSDSERGMFRVGAKKAVREKLMQARQGTNSVNRVMSEINLERMRRAFPTEEAFNQFRTNLRFEARIFETERVLHNSMTALRQKQAEAIEKGVDFQIPQNFGNDTAGMISNALNRIFNRGLSNEAKDQLASIILTPISDLPDATIQRINRTILQRTPQANRNRINQYFQTLTKSIDSASVAAPAVIAGIERE